MVILQEIEDKLHLHSQWLKDNFSGKRLELNAAILIGIDLTKADLRYAVLSRCFLQVANLHGAILRGADLQGANLQGADLEGANLENALNLPRIL